jgi:hypothetical protein
MAYIIRFLKAMNKTTLDRKVRISYLSVNDTLTAAKISYGALKAFHSYITALAYNTMNYKTIKLNNTTSDLVSTGLQLVQTYRSNYTFTC